jgi:hypothetical protein
LAFFCTCEVPAGINNATVRCLLDKRSWSTFWLTNPYSLPLFGQPKTKDLIDVFGQVNGSTTVYRFWPGKIHFKKSITISTEHGNHNDTPANYSSLVYYYNILQ